MQRRIFVSIASLVGLAAMMAAAPVSAATLPKETQVFTVTREGEPVGTHTIRYQTTGTGAEAGTDIDIETNVVVTVLMVPVYRFEHRGHETWRQDRLVALQSTTNDDGIHHTLTVGTQGDHLSVTGDNTVTSAPATIIPASLWNKAVVSQDHLLNTLTGRQMQVKVAPVGDETVQVHGHPVHAKRYVMTGELQRDLWYDDDGALVRMHFKGKDDSDIVYTLE